MSSLSLPYFVSRPDADGPFPGVVVIHEANGISPQLLRLSQRLAGEGYVVITPDLFFRSGGTEAAEYDVLMRTLEPAQVLADLEQAAALAREHGAERVGVIGFCMGGRNAWRAAVGSDVFAASVGFYGAGIAADLGEPRCPTLLIFGGSDPYIPTADIDAVVAHHPNTLVYPAAGHGFLRDGSDSFHEESAGDAWARTVEFLGANLRSA
jgi:carboxymethylenebutenolidase